MDRRASWTISSTTASGPRSGSVGADSTAQDLRAVLGHGAHDDIGAADVNPDDVTHRSPQSPAARRRPPVTACRNDDPAGTPPVHAANMAGRRGRPHPVSRSRGPRGPNPKAGTVGPKIATVGVPTACAKCSGAESFVTNTAACSIKAADWRNVSAPHAFRTVGTAALDLHRERCVVLPAHHHDRRSPRQPPGQLGEVRPSFAAPNRPWCQRHEPWRRPRVTQPSRGRTAVLRGETERRHHRRRRGPPRQRQQPVDLMTGRRPRPRFGVERAPAVAKPHPPRDAREQGQRGAPQRTVGKVRDVVMLRPRAARASAP